MKLHEVSHFSVHFAYFIWPDLAQLTMENLSCPASEALFLCGCLWCGSEQPALQVSTVDFLLSGTPVGLLEIGGSPEPKWFNGKNNLSFQSFLHRSCLRVECHVVSVSFMSLRNCGACPLVAPANHDSGHRAIRCCGI